MFRYMRSSLEEFGTSIEPTRLFVDKSRSDKKGILTRGNMVPVKSTNESLVRFCTSGRLPVSLFWPRLNLVNKVRLLIVGGTWSKKPLEARDKISNLLRLPILKGSEELNWLRLLNEEGTWPRKPLEVRDKISNLLRLPNSEGSEEEMKLLLERLR
ncbi:unnamed protein product [Thlaspi arvense]|uniref:Uncharacterized protein n=1 Tax=Thlaspi arvense TaxID=13288 RepID=A0AAU9R7X1_THLAR|nr:unnamed protein product [Thlaspi arvense]